MESIIIKREISLYATSQRKLRETGICFDAHGNMVTGFSSPEVIGYDTYT